MIVMLYLICLEGLQSGQMLRTVNPSSYDFDGSNPSPSTMISSSEPKSHLFMYLTKCGNTFFFLLEIFNLLF